MLIIKLSFYILSGVFQISGNYHVLQVFIEMTIELTTETVGQKLNIPLIKPNISNMFGENEL